MLLGSFLRSAVLLAAAALATPQPGLLRVPKVYNAVITSNQNLAPSRAFPVIQPVVHRTAIGYVPPPYYYGPFPPGYGGPVGPGVVPLQPGVIGDPRVQPQQPPQRPEDVESVEATDGASSPPRRISRPPGKAGNADSSAESSVESTEEASNKNNSKKGKTTDRVPLSFYPNYQSLYYDPYFYPYNAFPPQFVAPGTYYVDYPQRPGILGPLPLPPPPPGSYPIPAPPGRPETTPEGADEDASRRNEKQKTGSRGSESREKIPDVPAPPLPTAARKKTS